MAKFDCKIDDPQEGATYIWVSQYQNPFIREPQIKRITIAKIQKRPKHVITTDGMIIEYGLLSCLPLYEDNEQNNLLLCRIKESFDYLRCLERLRAHMEKHIDCTDVLPKSEQALYSALKTRCQELDR